MEGEGENNPLELMDLDEDDWVREFVDDLDMLEDYKIYDCPHFPHEAVGCPYVHPGELPRRCHHHFEYRPEICPSIPNCPNEDQCVLAHSIHEYCLHPLRFCYSQCWFGLECDNPWCHFAHYPRQLLEANQWLPSYPFYSPPRRPPWSPPPPPPPSPPPRPSKSI